MRRLTILLFICAVSFAYGQNEDKQFQVLVSKNAKVFGSELAPLAYVDDVTSIDIEQDGFVALVHKGGTTFELSESTFTFYLKAEKLKERSDRPPLEILYEDSAKADLTKTILVLHPKFDRSGLIQWRKDEPVEITWHMPDEPVIAYKISILDHNGKKIQDFGSKKNQFTLKPFNFGLEETLFMFQVSSSFAGETMMSKRYQISLVDAPAYPVKAADLVIKALDLELSPNVAIETWKEILGKENGRHYMTLFEKFVSRNGSKLNASEEDIKLLLSKDK